jgi:hypothetical protein
LALKAGSSNNVELNSLIVAMKEFERENSIEITLSGQLVDGVKGLDLVWRALAWDGDPLSEGAKLLASVNVSCRSTRLLSMEAVLFQLMYALDFQLALRELGSGEQKS